MYSDDDVAALYDVLSGWGPDDDFYLALAMTAESVLDVGCGTGRVLHRVRDAGHRGRLCGIDPDPASMRRARQRDDVEWVDGTAASMTWSREFDLALMTGHAFQALVHDDDVRDSLAAIARALVSGGRFAFETRNPRTRAWETWIPENATSVVDPRGSPVTVSHEVESVIGDVVTLAETTSDAAGVPLRLDRASLRFLDPDALDRLLAEAGFEVEARYGGWQREPFEPTSPEIVSVARLS